MSSAGCSNNDVLSFEQGPIRPPSEAKSLLVRVTRNCPWNKCAFCRTYKGTRFSIRSVEEVKQDIAVMKHIYDEVKELSWRLGCGGDVNERVIQQIYDSTHGSSSSYMNVAMWLYYGEGSVFLQDGNNLAMRSTDLAEILSFLKKTFPEISRITTYARAKTIARRTTLQDLVLLREAGLTRVHIGLESGSDQILTFIRKGVTAAEHIEAGRKVKEARLSLSEYVIPGLGGRELWQEHARETARVLNAIDPDFIRLRTLRVVEGAGLDESVAAGIFEPLGDEDIVREMRMMIEHLEGITSCLVSDHILNLLEEVEGRFPEDKTTMLAVINRFLQMPENNRRNFRLGRRASLYRKLDDMQNQLLYKKVENAVQQIERSGEDIEEVISQLTRQFI